MSKKTQIEEITPEELLSRVRLILVNELKDAVSPKKEKYVGVPEIAKFCDESPRWVYSKCKDKFLPHYKIGKNASLKFLISEVAEVIAKHKIECEYRNHFKYTIDSQGNIIE